MGPLAAPVVCQARIGSRHCFKIRPRPLISGTADAFASSMIASIHIAASSGSPQVPERRRSIRGALKAQGPIPRMTASVRYLGAIGGHGELVVEFADHSRMSIGLDQLVPANRR